MGEVPMPSCPGLLTTRVPALMLIWPEKLLLLLVSVSTLPPLMVRLPVPEISPAKVVLVPVAPMLVS